MKIKHGTVSEQGLVFWSYDSDGRERWFDPARYLFMKNRAAESQFRRYHQNPEVWRAKSRAGATKIGPKQRAETYKRWSSANKDKIRDRRLKRTYGISSVDYDRMLEAQGGKCAICGTDKGAVRKKTGSGYALYVDHCHATGVVRGLLCSNCNVAIGKLKDDPSLLTKAAEYVSAHKGSQNNYTAPAQMGEMQTQGVTQ